MSNPMSNHQILIPISPSKAESAWLLNAAAWKGPLEVEKYLARERHLANQAFTKDGGLTFWALVAPNHGSSESTISAEHLSEPQLLATCESFRKRALICRNGGPVEEVIAHGIGSVYCRESYRGRGYAGQMLIKLSQRLGSWQIQQEAKGQDRVAFAILYSDIGRKFYHKNGNFVPKPSFHIHLPPKTSMDPATDKIDHIAVRALKIEDVDDLCADDDAILRRTLQKRSKSSSNAISAAVVCDKETLWWHWAREDFLCEHLGLEIPETKGAMATFPKGRVWAFWKATRSEDEKDNVLNVLRIVVDDGTDVLTNGSGAAATGQEDVQLAIAAVLRAAQDAAHALEMPVVEIWNPSEEILAAAKSLEPSLDKVERESSSITSMRWYGAEAAEYIDWVANEKYSWC